MCKVDVAPGEPGELEERLARWGHPGARASRGDVRDLTRIAALAGERDDIDLLVSNAA